MDVHKINRKPFKILSNSELCFYSDSSHELEDPFYRFLEHHHLMIIFICKAKVVIFITWRVCLFWTCTYKTFLFELTDSWSHLNQRVHLCEVGIVLKIQTEGGFRPRHNCLVWAFSALFFKPRPGLPGERRIKLGISTLQISISSYGKLCVQL